jgi:hypothetical protein
MASKSEPRSLTSDAANGSAAPMHSMSIATHSYEVRPRKDHRGFDLISDALLWSIIELRNWNPRPSKSRLIASDSARKKCFAFEVITVYPASDSNGELRKMKTRGFVVTLFAVAFAFAPQLLKTSTAAPDAQQGTYAAKLVSPQAGDVVFPGQKVRIVWEALLPKLPVDLSWCEAEIYLSLDGGKSFPVIITPIRLDPNYKILSFDWTVGNTPTAAAVLDIRFGCEQFYPETRSVQTTSSFVIGR